MNSASIPKQTNPTDIMIARLEEANSRAYVQFSDRVGQADKQLSNRAHAANNPSDDPLTSANTLRPVIADRLPYGWLTRLSLGLIASVAVIILLWPSSYPDPAKQLMGVWASYSTSRSFWEAAKPGFAAQPSEPAVQVDRAKVTPQRTPSAAQTAPEDNAPTTELQTAESAQLLQTIARDLAILGQGIAQLKISQEQMARYNATFAEQFKANQEQTARDNAKITEQLEATQEQFARILAKTSKRNLRPKNIGAVSDAPARR